MPNSTGAATRPKKQERDQQAATVRRQTDSKRVQKQTSMTTEYRDRFLHPDCYTTIVSTSKLHNPCHPLKGSRADTSSYRSFYVTHKWTKLSSAARRPQAPAKDFRRRRSNLTASKQENQVSSEMDFTTIYNNCFRAWELNKRQPFRLEDNLKVRQGLGPQDEKQSTAANSESAAQNKEPKPFENISSYRADYAVKSLQGEGCFPNQQSHPAMRACVLGAKAACDINKELLHEASEFFKQFSDWTLETKFHGQVRGSGPPADHKIQSTARMIQGAGPTSSPMQTRDETKKPLQGVTPNATSPQPKMTKSAVCNSGCDATEASQCPAENTAFTGFECSIGNKEARMCWSSCTDRGVTEGDGCAEPSQDQQILSSKTVLTVQQ